MELNFKIHIIQDLLKKLKLYTLGDYNLSYMVRDINTNENNKIVEEYLPTLRKFFILPHKTRNPKKLTSQILLRIFQDLDIQYKKQTKLYYTKEGLKSTSGYYNYSFKDTECFEIIKLLKQNNI